MKSIVIGKETAQRVLDDYQQTPETFGKNRIGLEALAAYYRYYYHECQGEMDYKVNANSLAGRDDTLFDLLSTNALSVLAHQRIHQTAPEVVFRQSFQSAAKEFRVIDAPTQGVVVQHGEEGKELVADLCGAFDLEKQYRLLKKAQRYSVNLFRHEFGSLAEKGAIHEVQKGAGIFYLDEQYYSAQFGWSDEPIRGMQVQIV